MDNIATVEELIFSVLNRSILGHILKVNFCNASDMVDRDFLHDMWAIRGIGSHWVSCVKTLLESSKAIIMVNGASSRYIRY